MKIVVLGCGNIGSVVARDLAQSLPSAQITMADVNAKRAEEAVSRINQPNVSWIQTDASNRSQLVKALKKFDLAVGTLPGFMGFESCKASIAAKVDMVDVSYMPEDVMLLNKSALKAGICLVPDCGMSPGLGNVLAGHAISLLDDVESVHMINGGLPEKPVPPLGYVVRWSVKDLIDMYSRKVSIVKDGKIAKVEPMTGLEIITFPKVGKLEAFYTDGLRTLLHTVKNVREMWEKTLRYPGHVEKIKLLKDLGFFDEKPVDVGSFSVSPRDLTAKLFDRKLTMPQVADIVVMFVDVQGFKNGKKILYSYSVLDRHDKVRKVTAMARSTAYTASVMAQLVAKKVITEKGVVSPEKLGMNLKIYRKFMDAMKKRGFRIGERKKLCA